MEDSEHHAFTEALEDHGGKEDEVIGVFVLCEVEGTKQRVGVKEDVRISKEQPGRRGLTGGEAHGVRLAEPSGREVGDVDDGQAGWRFGRNAVHDGAGRVGRAVVDRDDMDGNGDGCKQSAHGGPDAGFFVAGGNDDRNQRKRRGFEGAEVARVEKIGNAGEVAQRGENQESPEENNQPVEDKQNRNHAAFVELVLGVRTGAKREPAKRMIPEATRAMSVMLRPMRRLVASDTRPMRCGEKASPRAWMTKRLTEMAVARMGAAMELTMAALSGPVPRKRKNSARNAPGMKKEGGPKKTAAANGMARMDPQAESR